MRQFMQEIDSPSSSSMMQTPAHRRRRRRRNFSHWSNSQANNLDGTTTRTRYSEAGPLPAHVSQYELDYQKQHRTFREEPLFFTSGQVALVVFSVVLFFFYLPIIETCSKMLLCEELEFGPGVYINVLVADRRIDCTTTEYGRYRVGALLTMLVIGLGFPLSCVLVVRLYAARSPLPEFSDDLAMKWRQTRRLFFFLTGGYTSRRWWWESVVLTRKGLIAILSVAIADIRLRNYVSMWAVGVYLVLHLKFAPFEESILSNLETLSLLTIFTTLNLAATFDTFSGEEHPQLESFLVGTIMTLNGVCMLVFGLVFVRAAWRKLREIHLANPQMLPCLSVCFPSNEELADQHVTHAIQRHREELLSLNECLESMFREQSQREDFMFSAIDLLDHFAGDDDKDVIDAADDGDVQSLAHHFSPSVRTWHAANEHFIMQSRLLRDHSNSAAVVAEAHGLLQNIFAAEELILQELLLRQQEFNNAIAVAATKTPSDAADIGLFRRGSYWADTFEPEDAMAI
jgi:hypothetical protein